MIRICFLAFSRSSYVSCLGSVFRPWTWQTMLQRCYVSVVSRVNMVVLREVIG